MSLSHLGFFRVKDVTCDNLIFSPSVDPSFCCLIRLGENQNLELLIFVLERKLQMKGPFATNALPPTIAEEYLG